MHELGITEFWAKVELGTPDKCWLWQGILDPDGYGHFGKRGKAHRIAYELNIGKIPPGKILHHICFQCSCVNPAHLEMVTQREHFQRHIINSQQNPAAIAARATHCPQGHPYDLINTKFYKGMRYCRTCMRTIRKIQLKRKRLKLALEKPTIRGHAT